VCTDGGILARGHGPHGGSVPRLLSGSHNHTSTKLSFFVLQLAAFFFEKEKKKHLNNFKTKSIYIFTPLLLLSFQKADCVQIRILKFKEFVCINIEHCFPFSGQSQARFGFPP
jgi:hypothetical protein